MEDGAQGRKHIDLLGESYAEETYKARKAWTPTPYHCKIPWINFIPYILPSMSLWHYKGKETELLQGYKQLVQQVYLVGKSNKVGFG